MFRSMFVVLSGCSCGHRVSEAPEAPRALQDQCECGACQQGRGGGEGGGGGVCVVVLVGAVGVSAGGLHRDVAVDDA